MTEHTNRQTRQNSGAYRWRWALAAAGTLLLAGVLVYFFGSAAATPIVQAKLQAMIRSQLNAELSIGRISYAFPYGVRVRDARLTTVDSGGRAIEVLSLPELEIALARLPFGDGPLVVERIVLDRPTVHIIRSAQGDVVGKAELARPASGRTMKLSDMFQLRRVTVRGARVTYEDPARGGVPVVWRDIDVRLTTSPDSSPVYRFDLQAASRPLTTLSAAGTFDIDELFLDLRRLQMHLEASAPGGDSPAPPQLQRWLQRYGVAGAVELSGNAQVPLKRPESARLEATVRLRDGRGEWPGGHGSIDRLAGVVRVSTSPLTAAQELSQTAAFLTTAPSTQRAAASGPADQIAALEATAHRLDGGVVPPPVPRSPSAHGLRSAVEELEATAAMLKRTEGEPVVARPLLLSQQAEEQLRQTARLIDAGSPATRPATAPAAPAPVLYVLVEDGTIVSGSRRIAIDKIDLLLDWKQQAWRLPSGRATIALGGGYADLPTPMRKTMEEVGIDGSLALQADGGGSLVPGANGRRKYAVNVHATADRVRLTPRKLLLTNARADAILTPAGLSFPENGGTHRGVYADFYGGVLHAVGQVQLRKPTEYSLVVRAAGVDLAPFSRDWSKPGDKPLDLAGLVYGSAQIHGSGRVGDREPLDTLAGYGDIEVFQGDFYRLPALAEILSVVAPGQEAGTVGYAAAIFDVDRRKIVFPRVAVSAPVLGVQGSGSVGFSGELDFRVTAVPLADWRQAVQRTGIPVVGDLVGDVAGGVQKILDTATGKLLYQFRVTGKIGEPSVLPQPLPVLTDSAAHLFAFMLDGRERLLEEMKGQ